MTAFLCFNRKVVKPVKKLIKHCENVAFYAAKIRKGVNLLDASHIICSENKTILKTTFCVDAPVVSSVRFAILLPEQKITPV